MFHDMLASLKEHLPLSPSSITTSNRSFIHMPFLLVVGIRFIYSGFLLICDSWRRGRFSLSITCWSCMPLRHLWSTFKYMIVEVFEVPTSRNSMECVLAQLMVCPFFFVQIQKCSNFGNVSITCSKYCYSRIDESIKKLVKFSKFIDVQVMGRNLYEQLIWAN
jgi:hypothetical protein